MTRFLSALLVLTTAVCSAAQKRLVLIDQDGSGPGGSNQMAMMALLQSPQVQVLGITIVTGNAWRDEEVQHTLRMLELIGRATSRSLPGAVFPLVRTQKETELARSYGRGHLARRVGRRTDLAWTSTRCSPVTPESRRALDHTEFHPCPKAPTHQTAR